MENSEESPRSITQTMHDDIKVLRKQEISEEVLKDQKHMPSDYQRNTESRDAANPENGKVEPCTVTIRLCPSEATDCSGDAAQVGTVEQIAKQETVPPHTPVFSNRKALTTKETFTQCPIPDGSNTTTDTSKHVAPNTPTIEDGKLAEIEDAEVILTSTTEMKNTSGAVVDEGMATEETAQIQPYGVTSEMAKPQPSEVDQGSNCTILHEEATVDGNRFSEKGIHVDIIMKADIPESLRHDVVEAWGEDGPLDLDRPSEEENAIETSYTWEPSSVVNEGAVFENYASGTPLLPRIDSQSIDEDDIIERFSTNTTKTDLETEEETAKKVVDSSTGVTTTQSSTEDLDRELESIIPSFDEANNHEAKGVNENHPGGIDTETEAGLQPIEENTVDNFNHQEEKKEDEYSYSGREMGAELHPINEEVHEESNSEQDSSATDDDDDNSYGLEVAVAVPDNATEGENQKKEKEMFPSPEATTLMSDSNAELKEILRKEQIEMAYEKCDFLMRKFVLEVKIGELRDDVAFLSKKKFELNRIMLGIQIRQLREV